MMAIPAAVIASMAMFSSTAPAFLPMGGWDAFAAKPTLFVVGDSISIDYGPALEQLVGHRWQYGRKNRGRDSHDWSLDGANGGDSSHVLAYLQHLASEVSSPRGLFDERLVSFATPSKLSGRKPDVLLLNSGLHDVKCDLASGGETPQIAPEEYEQNIRKAIQTSFDGLGANHVVWVRTTPIVDAIHNDRFVRFHRHGWRVEEYNKVADRVCHELGVPIIDLHSFTAALGESAYQDNVHFKPSVATLQAQFIASELEKILTREPQSEPSLVGAALAGA